MLIRYYPTQCHSRNEDSWTYDTNILEKLTQIIVIHIPLPPRQSTFYYQYQWDIGLAILKPLSKNAVSAYQILCKLLAFTLKDS